MLSPRTRGISTSWSGGAVLVSSCSYPPPRCRGRVVVALSRRCRVRAGRSSWIKLVSELSELFKRLLPCFSLDGKPGAGAAGAGKSSGAPAISGLLTLVETQAS